MVTISLSNRNPLSQCQLAHINIATGICTLADNRQIERRHLVNELDFSHPLLTEQYITKATDHLYHYQYDDIDGFLYSAIYVYSTLLHVDEPQRCQFKISPSTLFKRAEFKPSVYFSINSNKAAQEVISIRQLEALISHLIGFKFEYSEDFIIDELFTMDDLPSSVDGDNLFKTSLEITQLLKSPSDFAHLELRYIDPTIGFGVFARRVIQPGEILSLYTGKKKLHIDHVKYAYARLNDCLSMYIDARQFGNLMRFVNHAPHPSKSLAPKSVLLEANADITHHYLHGIQVVAYSANRVITQGEQLFVDYGEQAAEQGYSIRFIKNGKMLGVNLKTRWDNALKKVTQLKIMAIYGVKRAQIYLLLRMFMILTAIFVFIGVLIWV